MPKKEKTAKLFKGVLHSGSDWTGRFTFCNGGMQQPHNTQIIRMIMMDYQCYTLHQEFVAFIPMWWKETKSHLFFSIHNISWLKAGVQLSQLDDNVVLRMIKHFFYAREKNTHLIPPLTSQLNSSDWYESVIHSDWQRLLAVVVVEHFLYLWLCEKNHFNLWTFDRRSDSCVHVCRQVPGWMSGESEHIVRMWW